MKDGVELGVKCGTKFDVSAILVDRRETVVGILLFL